jgi:hypothetical protein
MYCVTRNYTEDETKEYTFLLSGLNGSKWLTSGSDCFNPKIEPVIPFDMRAKDRSRRDQKDKNL